MSFIFVDIHEASLNTLDETRAYVNAIVEARSGAEVH